MQTLDEIRRALRARTGSEDVPKLLNTRVFLRTGVNLMDAKQARDRSPMMVAKVVGALNDFGYSLS